MTTHPMWSDQYWPLLMQIYMRSPKGIKPMYSKSMVNLALELHVPPQILFSLMFSLRRTDIPHVRRLWTIYGDNPRRLARAVTKVRSMEGFGCAKVFYDGVDVIESFERHFRPVDGMEDITPAMLVMILDLYFRLTPITMVAETPEVMQMARMLHIKTGQVVEIMMAFQVCDPYIHRNYDIDNSLQEACQEIWNKYGNDCPEDLAAYAAQLKEYFK
ncbi:MAG: hypothetical protein ACI4V5_04385 [Prevotella sp.]